MKRISGAFIFPLIALVILIYVLSNKMFNIPPLGKVLNPFIGVVQNNGDKNMGTNVFKINVDGLSDSVDIFFDIRNVPHIYAKNDGDLYFAQGYITAYLRLWQMDFLSYVAAGRLSEIFDDQDILTYDRNQRRLGILEAAGQSLKLIEKDSQTYVALTSYTKGVNAYISKLSFKQLPTEYKLLDYKPEMWTNLKSVLLLKLLGTTLTGYDEDAYMSKLILALGEDNFNKLFPDFTSHVSPVMAKLLPSKNTWFNHLKVPSGLNYSFLSLVNKNSRNLYNPLLGSNSWAVSGKKTKSGFPILASDPHLNLSLPSFWLEMQLNSPDMNTYGVSIPGTPAIIIGFNNKIAWGITNGADDVKDWYKLKIDEKYDKYEMDNEWIKLPYFVAEIKRKNRTSFYDTIYHSVHGPIVTNQRFPDGQGGLMNYALKWELLNPSNEFLTFLKLNHSRNFSDYRNAIKSYSCPALNFTFACNDNTIAINHQGRMAKKEAGQGRFLLDGSVSSQIFSNYIPNDSLPQVVNPELNYVFSANQHPTFPNYPYYYNGYYSESRANRINEMLNKENKFDINKMELMQLDNKNSFAEEALPVFVGKVNKFGLNLYQDELLKSISAWNCEYDLISENAELFEIWLKKVRDLTWDELAKYSFYIKPPDDYVLLDLIRQDPTNEYFDRTETSLKETAYDVITEAFVEASEEYAKLKKSGSVKWGAINKVDIMHMTNISAFSKMGLSSSGSPQAINAMSKNWGPSWRMIVELSDTPIAYGIYPGGQSGNIGSKHYDDFIADWNAGRYYRLLFFMSESEAKSKSLILWTLK